TQTRDLDRRKFRIKPTVGGGTRRAQGLGKAKQDAGQGNVWVHRKTPKPSAAEDKLLERVSSIRSLAQPVWTSVPPLARGVPSCRNAPESTMNMSQPVEVVTGFTLTLFSIRGRGGRLHQA